MSSIMDFRQFPDSTAAVWFLESFEEFFFYNCRSLFHPNSATYERHLLVVQESAKIMLMKGCILYVQWEATLNM